MEEYKNVIIPFWSGRSMRDLIFQEMTPSGKMPTMLEYSPSSWSSGRPATPSPMVRSTPWA